ncbi:hypothetical protein A2U01_0032602, partial [Trifolium medium]|nr:hypothetical protein [Trifolium medium]
MGDVAVKVADWTWLEYHEVHEHLWNIGPVICHMMTTPRLENLKKRGPGYRKLDPKIEPPSHFMVIVGLGQKLIA